MIILAHTRVAQVSRSMQPILLPLAVQLLTHTTCTRKLNHLLNVLQHLKQFEADGDAEEWKAGCQDELLRFGENSI